MRKRFTVVGSAPGASVPRQGGLGPATAVAHAFALLLRLLLMSDREKDVEILVLRRQLTVLQRRLRGRRPRLGGRRPRLRPEDRALSSRSKRWRAASQPGIVGGRNGALASRGLQLSAAPVFSQLPRNAFTSAANCAAYWKRNP
jgi:hypothetical protein